MFDLEIADNVNHPKPNELTTEMINTNHHRVLFGERQIGYFIMDVDGYYYFDFLTTPSGWWSSDKLKMVAELLEKMNKPYDDMVTEYFKNENKQ